MNTLRKLVRPVRMNILCMVALLAGLVGASHPSTAHAAATQPTQPQTLVDGQWESVTAQVQARMLDKLVRFSAGNCRPKDARGAGVIATVQCDYASMTVVYDFFDSKQAMDHTTSTISSVATPWHYSADPESHPQGMLWSYKDGNCLALAWTHNQALLAARVIRHDGNLSAVRDWWSQTAETL